MAAPNQLFESNLLMYLTKYLRLANYLSACQLYLKDNVLLESELTPEHIKDRILGHWGTVPGLNFIYANLNVLIKRHRQKMMLVVGPGHGYPSLLSNLYLEGTLGEYYPEYKQGKEAMQKLIKNFSWPRSHPSHSNPETPGVIMEGGELGYALGIAFGAAFDNPDLIVACIVGDGEAETATTAASWHSSKFLNPKTSGAVLPIVHINKYKISGPTIYGTMSNDELVNLFTGYGYHPIIVEGDFLYEPMLYAMEEAYQKIKEIQKKAREEGIIDKPLWPVILLKTKKGWTGPKELNNISVEDSFRSHGVPLEHPKTDNTEFGILKKWLQSYNIKDLVDENFCPIEEIMNIVPERHLRLGKSPDANGERMQKLKLPNLFDFAFNVSETGKSECSNMELLSSYLKAVMKENSETFRIMSPDESESNKLHSLFEVTKRAYVWPVPAESENIGPEGRVMEVLSENLLTAWMIGYTMTGRNAILISYEAFMMITASMVDQYIKFLKHSKRITWRKPVPSLNIILTSSSWIQEHNGFSHQNPGFISNFLNKYTGMVDIHFPVDANMLLATAEQCLQNTNKVNIIVCGKRAQPQYMNVIDARNQMRIGLGIWHWAGNEDQVPDIVFAATGDHMTIETIGAVNMLKNLVPEIKTRFVSVSEVNNFNIGDLSNPGKSSFMILDEYFTSNKPIIYSYHGYPSDIKQLLYGYTGLKRLHLHGYLEKGTTTTPFDMMVINNCSRFQLALEAISIYGQAHPNFKNKQKQLEIFFKTMLSKNEIYIQTQGTDMPDIHEIKM